MNFFRALDTAYRQLADHARMVTVCLNDGLLPDSAPKMRNVLRKSFQIMRDKFDITEAQNCADLMYELSLSVSDTLKFHYKDDSNRQDIIRSVMDFESEHLRSQMILESKAMKNLMKKAPKVAKVIDVSEASHVLDVFKLLERGGKTGIINGALTGDLAYKIIDSLGVGIAQLKRICDLYGVQLDDEALAKKKDEVKSNSKYKTALSHISQIDIDSDIPATDDHWKYHYRKSEATKYSFPLVQADLLKVIDLDNDKKAVLLSSTCCYGEAGGQEGDQGTILGLDGQTLFNISDTQLSENGHVWHIGTVALGRQLIEKSRVKVKFDINRRIKLMQNHTGTHLLNGVLRKMFKYASQKSSHIHANGFKFEFTALDATIDASTVTKIEEMVNSYINMGASVDQITVDNPEASFENDTSLEEMLTEEFPNKSVITMPEETYPGDVTVISLPDFLEPCCGTHVLDTADVQAFVITAVRSTHPGQKSLKCLTGKKALDAREAGLELIEAMININEQLASANTEEAFENIRTTVKLLLKKSKDGNNLPFAVRTESAQILNELSSHVSSLIKSPKSKKNG